MKAHMKLGGVRMRTSMILALAAAMASSAFAAAPRRSAPGAAASVDWRRCMATIGQRLDFTGAALISRRGSTSLYARGLSGPPGSAPLDPGYRFNLASEGKMFTAVAVGQLMDAGWVRLDDPIGRWVGGLTPEASAVTVRQLLTHSSGLGDFLTPENLPTIIAARGLSDLKPLIARDKPAFTPGARFSYSNSGFVLLGLLVERASGQSYGDYLRTHVFAPAGMSASGLAPGGSPPMAFGMTAMGPEGPTAVHRAPTLRGGSAGGGFSTVGDMRKFFAALLAGKLVRPETARLMTSPQIVARPAEGDTPEFDYGLGFGVGRFEGHRWFGHNGGAPGANGEAATFPDDEITLIVLANRDPPLASRFFRALRAAAFSADPAC